MADWCAAAEITLVTDAVGGRQTFYVATHGFSSATSDTPANTAFRELLEDPGGPARSMFSGARVTGPIAIDAGTLKLKNGAGEFDDWPTDYGTAGGTVVVRWGRVGDAYPSAWTLVYRAEIKSLSVDLDYCALGLRNRLYLLDKPVVTDVFAGTGGLEGTGTTSKRKQIAIDEPGYIPLVLLDSVKQLYFVQANASDVRALAGTFPPYYYVFDGGVALTHGGYYTTAADFANGAAPAAGYFKVWAEGWDTTGASAGNAPGPLYVRLGSPPANDLRIATLGYLMNVGDAPTNIRRWKLTDLCNRAGMLDVTPGAMGSRSVNLELGGRLLQGDESYLDVMTDVCKWRHAAVGFTRDDRFFCRELLDPLDTSDPADTVRYVFTEHNAKQYKRTPIPGADAPIWQVSVNAGKTWPCQVANGAPAAVREAMLREPWQTSFTGTSDDVKASNPGAGTAKVDIVGNVFVTKADKQAFVNRYLMLHGGRRDYLQLRCTQVDADTLALELGDKVQVMHARMGCTPARTFRVVRIEPAELVSREPGIVFGLWGGAAGPAASALGGGSTSASAGGSGAAVEVAGRGVQAIGDFTQVGRGTVSATLGGGAQNIGDWIQVGTGTVSDNPLAGVILLVQGGTNGSTTIVDRSTYADSVAINNYASFDSGHQVFGENTIKGVTIYAGVDGFTSSGASSRFGRATGDKFTVEIHYRFHVLENYSISSMMFAWWSSGGRILEVGTYSPNKLRIRFGDDASYDNVATLSADTDYFIQVNVDGSSITVDLDGTEVLSGSNVYGINYPGDFAVYVAGGGPSGNFAGATSEHWTTPLRMTKGILRARGSVPTELFPT